MLIFIITSNNLLSTSDWVCRCGRGCRCQCTGPWRRGWARGWADTGAAWTAWPATPCRTGGIATLPHYTHILASHVLSCQKVDWVQEEAGRVPEQRRSSLGRLQKPEPVGAGQEGAGREVEAWRPEEAAPATLQRTARQGDRQLHVRDQGVP